MENKIKNIKNSFKNRNYKEAIKESKKFLEKNHNSSIFNILGISLAMLNKNNDAIKTFNDAIIKYPDNEELKINLAKIFTKERKFTETIKIYDALYQQTGNDDYKIELANSHIMCSDYDKGNKLINDLIEKDSNNIILLNKVAQLLIKVKKFDKAVEYLERANTLSPGNIGILNNLAIAYKFCRKYNDALNIFLKLLNSEEDTSSHFHIYNNIGTIYMYLDKLDEAKNFFEKSLSIKPNDESTNFNNGNLLRRCKEYDQASVFYKKSGKIGIPSYMEMLYQIDDKENFKNNILKLSKNDPFNIRVAAISEFASEQWDIENHFPFCQNPIQYLSHLNIEEDIKDYNFDYSKLLEDAQNLIEIWEPEDSEVKKGIQTFGNIFDIKSKNMKIFENIILKEIEKYRIFYKNKNSLFINNWPEDFYLNGWMVNLESNGYQNSHIHQNSWMSGVFYINIPNDSSGKEGAIRFSLQGFDYQKRKDKSKEKIVKPKIGDLVLFPSSLFHSVIPFNSNENRVCLAFDVIKK